MSKPTGTCPPTPSSAETGDDDESSAPKLPTWKIYRGTGSRCAYGGCGTSSKKNAISLVTDTHLDYKYMKEDPKNCLLCNKCYKMLSNLVALSTDPSKAKSNTVDPRTPTRAIKTKKKRATQESESLLLNYRTRSKRPRSNTTQSPIDQPPGSTSKCKRSLLLALATTTTHKKLMGIVTNPEYGGTHVYNSDICECNGDMQIKDTPHLCDEGGWALFTCSKCEEQVAVDFNNDGKATTSRVHPTHLGASSRGQGWATSDLRRTMLAVFTNQTREAHCLNAQLDEPQRKPVHEGTWWKINDLIWEAVEQHYKEKEEEMFERIRRRGEWVMCIDFAWSHVNHASQGNVVVLDFATKLPVLIIPVAKARYLRDKHGNDRVIVKATGGYGGTSKGMEAFGTLLALDRLREAGLLRICKGRVSDADGSLDRIMASFEDTKDIPKYLDPGHTKRNFVKELNKLFTTKVRFRLLARRMGGFYLRCIMESWAKYPPANDEDGNLDCSLAIMEFLTRWSFFIPHYTKGLCEAECPCKKGKGPQGKDWDQEADDAAAGYDDDDATAAADDGSDDETRSHEISEDANELASTLSERAVTIGGTQYTRLYIDPVEDAALVNELRLLHVAVCNSASSIVHGMGTPNTEAVNAARCADTSKRIEYPKSWAARCLLVYLRYHTGYGYYKAVAEKLMAPLTEDQCIAMAAMSKRREQKLRQKATPASKKKKSDNKKVNFGRSEQAKQWNLKNNIWEYKGRDAGVGWKEVDTDYKSMIELGSGYVQQKEKKKKTTNKSKKGGAGEEAAGALESKTDSADSTSEAGVPEEKWQCPICKGKPIKKTSKASHLKSKTHLKKAPQLEQLSPPGPNQVCSEENLGCLKPAELSELSRKIAALLSAKAAPHNSKQLAEELAGGGLLQATSSPGCAAAATPQPSNGSQRPAGAPVRPPVLIFQPLDESRRRLLEEFTASDSQ